MARIFAEATLLDGPIPRPACLTIHPPFIVAVDEASPPPDPGDVAVYLPARYVVVPALINAHAHLALSMLRGVGGLSALRGNVVEDLYFRVEAHLTAEDVLAFSRIGAYECLLTGTGLVWDHYYHAPAVARAAAEVGLCAALAPTLQDLGGPGVAALETSLHDTLAIAADPALQAAGISAVLGPHATDTVSDALWARVGALAQDHRLPIHAHLAQSPDELRRSIERRGCPPLTALRQRGLLSTGQPIVLAHGLYVGADELPPLADEDAVLAFCPASQAQFDFPAPAAAWQAAGGRVALGTDAGSCNDSMDLQAEIRLAAAGPAFALTDDPTRRALARDITSPAALAAFTAARRAHHDQKRTPADLLAMAWTVPGSLHPRLPAGRIAPGHLANLAVYDRHHPALWPGHDPLQALAYGRCAGALHAMMTAGRWRGTPGDFHRSILASDAYQGAAAEASARLDAILRRAGLL